METMCRNVTEIITSSTNCSTLYDVQHALRYGRYIGEPIMTIDDYARQTGYCLISTEDIYEKQHLSEMVKLLNHWLDSTDKIIDEKRCVFTTGFYLLSSISLLIELFGIVSNVLLLIAIIIVTEIRSPFYICLANLAVADTLYLLCNGIIWVLDLVTTSDIWINWTSCVLLRFMDSGPFVCSILIVTLITIERYVAVCHPFKLQTLMTRRRIMIGLVVIWTVTSILGIGKVFSSQSHTSDYGVYLRKNVAKCYIFTYHIFPSYTAAVIAIGRLFPIALMSVLYILISVKLWRSRRSDGNSENNNRARTQAVIMMGIVSLLIAICVLPFSYILLKIMYIDQTLRGEDNRSYYYTFYNHFDNEWFIWATRLAEEINSAANPLIYTIVSSDFRAKMATAFKRCKLWCTRERDGD